MITQKSKSLFSTTTDGVTTQIRCVVNLHTEHVGFSTLFQKSPGNTGASESNKECSQYLGIIVGERMLLRVFKNVEVMPFGNQGYDFICNSGYKIDVKSATKMKNHNGWMFNINRNQIADYFLCLAFDDRENLNPKHIWLIPGEKVNHLIGLAISISTMDKWSQYELTNKLNDVIECCNILKNKK